MVARLSCLCSFHNSEPCLNLPGWFSHTFPCYSLPLVVAPTREELSCTRSLNLNDTTDYDYDYTDVIYNDTKR